MEDYRLEQSGQEVQDIMNGAAMQVDLTAENERAELAEQTLQGKIDDEETRAKAAEKQNADDIDALEEKVPSGASSSNKLATEEYVENSVSTKQDTLTFDNVPTEGSNNPVKSGGVYSADKALSDAIEAILLLIPSAATSLNKLADKAFVNSSIATASATFRGTYNLVTDLSLTVSATHAQIATALAGAVSDEDNNDYAFVQIPTSDATPTQIAKTERYKFNGTAWEYEYDLNNSGYTAAQWAAINSGITEALVTKLSALPTNAELTTALGVLTSSITTINQKIPSAASQANQLVDTAAMESYIVQVLDVLTASFNVISTDGHVTVQISQVDGKITSVSVSTSDIASAASLSLIAGRVTTAEGNISTNAADIANLQDAYAALTQSALVVVQPTDTWPVASPATSTIYRVVDRTNTPPQYYSDYMWNGTAMVLMATYDNAIDDVPTAGSNNLVKSGGVYNELALGAVYDVSAKNPTAGPNNDGKWESLSALFSDANLSTLIPTSVRKGGMSIKFVQSSDNKYVQYRLMDDTWSINTEDWSFCGNDVYVENPEFVYVKTDAENKILLAIRTDGSIYYGAGVPQQIIDYINKRIAELSLDEYEDIVAFLDDLEKEDKTLQMLLNEKVDKEEGKSLIDAEISESLRFIENPEYLDIKTDNEDKILEAITIKGRKEINIPIDTPAASFETQDNPEFIAVETDAEDKVLSGRKTNGTKVENLPVEFKDKVSVDDDIYVKGNIRVNERFDVDGNIIENIQDLEGRIEIKTDADGRILAFRDSEGKVVENVGVVADTGIFNHLMLTEDGMMEFEQALIDSGFNPGSSEIPFKNKDLVRIFDDNNLSIYRNYNSRKLVAGFRNVVVWADRFSLSISTDGFDGEQTVIVLNSTNFPNLIDNSRVGRIILMPWTRNAVNGYDGSSWRMAVITNLGQIYHNFPSRAVGSDGSALAGDEFRFDESVVWELPERWSPVRTTTGDDATLIASGKYKYFPGLNDSAYTFHPAINQDNGYGNGGFPAYIDKDNELHQTTRYGRFTQYRRDDEQDNSFIFMAGCATHEKLTLLGTYRSNRTKQTRTCVFITNDGGRQWFCRYEFGIGGYRIDGNDNVIIDAVGSTIACDTNALANPVTITDSFSSPASGDFSIVGRYQYVPSADFKEIELTKKFKWLTPVTVQNITIDENNHVIIECANHGLHNGEVVAFVKNTNTVTDWDWIVNDGFGALSCGNGVIFSVRVVDSNTLELCNNYANPHNNLSVRHIHSINRCKDGYTIGTGEFYPEGWILYLPVFQSDSFARKYPWDTMEFVRLNSTRYSIQRPLGVELAQDTDNTVTVGIDNEFTPIDDAELPEGRSESIRRSSNGLWRGKLVDFDDQNKFSCIFQSDEVCYFYRNIWGIDIYIGQQGHIGVSSDDGIHWTEARTIDNEAVCAGGIPQGSFDVVTGGYIVIDNYIFKNKGINL